MVHLLSIVQILLSVILVVLVLLQRANTDASGAYGAEGSQGAALEKRGTEKTLYRLTVVVAVLFISSLAYPLFA